MLGMELFAYKVRFDSEGNPINLDQYGGMSTTVGESPRENFDSFLNAFVTIFIVLIGDVINFQLIICRVGIISCITSAEQLVLQLFSSS